MRNLTITVDETLARWARVEAARNDMSLSRFVSKMLSDRMRQSEEYEAAMRHNLLRAPTVLKTSGSYPAREDLHGR